MQKSYSRIAKVGTTLLLCLLTATSLVASDSPFSETSAVSQGIRYWKSDTESLADRPASVPTRTDPRLLVVMYHNIVYGRTGNVYNRDLYNFEYDLRALQRNYTITDFSELQSTLATNSATTDQAIVTFDDGDLSIYAIVFPLLKEYGISATFFLVPAYVGTVGYISWDQAREMARYRDKDGRRLFYFGSHSLTHRPLGELDETEIYTELAESKRAIEQQTGYPVNTLALPFGNGAGDERIIEIARQLGYRAIRTSIPKTTKLNDLDMMQLGGYNVENYSTDTFVKNITRLSER
jgi:peptidoglycan/xylan/chitin deacetylase (PgdA/CDA1 family)